MNKSLKLSLLIISLVAICLLLLDQELKKSYIMPTMSDHTKVFTYGDIEDVRDYLNTSDSYITINDYYTLIDLERNEILEILLRDYKYNPDFNFQYNLSTPLLHAAKEIKINAVKIFVKYGATVNYKNPYGITPLIAASYTTVSQENPASLEITKMLVQAGADINAVSNFGKTSIEGALVSNDISRVKFLVENGGDIHHLNSSGANYMFYCDYMECFEYFLSQGFDINSTNNNGKSILQGAHNSRIPLSLTKQLLSWGADICHKDIKGDTVMNYIERQNTGPHDQKENPGFYNKKVKENRATVVYKYLEKEYSEKCLSNSIQ